MIPVKKTTQNGNRPAEKARADHFEGLYLKCFPAVAAMIAKSGGALDDAREVFQEALLVFYEKSLDDSQPELPRDEGAYLFGICRFLWYKDQRHQAKFSQTKLHFDLPEEAPVLPNQSKKLNFLETAGKKCMEILKSFYYDNASAEELRDIYGFSSERSATVQKYKCLEKVRSVVKEKSMHYEDFLQ